MFNGCRWAYSMCPSTLFAIGRPIGSSSAANRGADSIIRSTSGFRDHLYGITGLKALRCSRSYVPNRRRLANMPAAYD